MKLFLIGFLLLNLLYFACVANLTVRARQRNQPERGKYVDFTTGFVLPAFNVALGGYFSARVQIQIYWIYGSLFLKLPVNTKYNECDPPSYGVSFTDVDGDGWQQIHWHWGRKYWIWNMPWTLNWVRTSRLLNDGISWEHETKMHRVDSWENKERYWAGTYPYRYLLKDGTAQHRYATLTVVERKWRRKWLMFTDLFSRTFRRIEIDFDREVGERTGLWKGGVMGCGYALRQGEHPERALRRMEAERLFN